MQTFFLVGRRNANIKMQHKLICKNLDEIPFIFLQITMYKLVLEISIWGL